MADVDPDSAESFRLLDEFRGGDGAAFGRLFDRHQPGLQRFISRRLDPRVRARLDASDVLQETRLEAYRRMEDYLSRRPMPFRVWLRRMAYERLLKVRRYHVDAARRSVQRELDLPDQSSLHVVQPLLNSSSVSRQLRRSELVRRVRTVLSDLSEPDRQVLLLRHAEDLPYREIGHILDIEPAAARKRYGRALLRLRGLLLEAGLLEELP
jgi:RNA polymerase sigma-70 factor (ECF subfamily)